METLKTLSSCHYVETFMFLLGIFHSFITKRPIPGSSVAGFCFFFYPGDLPCDHVILVITEMELR